MCGRFALATPADDLVETFGVPPLDLDVSPRFNIAPGQEALVVAVDRRGRRMGVMRWGVVPRRGATGARVLVNARGETAWKTPTFRDAFHHRRCVVPADGFYEWRAGAGGRIPFFFRSASGGVLALAGLWSRGLGSDGTPWSGFIVLTVDANPEVAPVHARMPLVLGPGGREAWLDPASPATRLRELMLPAPAGTLVGYAVSQRVNRVTEDDPGLVEPA